MIRRRLHVYIQDDRAIYCYIIQSMNMTAHTAFEHFWAISLLKLRGVCLHDLWLVEGQTTWPTHTKVATLFAQLLDLLFFLANHACPCCGDSCTAQYHMIQQGSHVSDNISQLFNMLGVHMSVQQITSPYFAVHQNRRHRIVVVTKWNCWTFTCR